MTKVKIEARDEPSADDLDCMPLIKRRKLLHLHKPYSSSFGAPPARPVDVSVKRVHPGVLQEWSGLPKGVKFDPSDEELLWHLLAKVGKGEAEPHPLIGKFIISLDEDDGFGYFHPQKLPGVKQDGSVSYFFHRTFKAFWNTQNDDFGDVRWRKIGKTKPVVIDGIHQGSKKMMILYMAMKKGEKPEKTNWVMHQYHLGRGQDEGEFVASKIFYQHKSRQSDKNAQNLRLESVEAFVDEAEAVVCPISVEPEIRTQNQPLNLISTKTSDQASAVHEAIGEELKSHAGWKKLDNRDNHPKEEPKRGEIEQRVRLDSQQRVEGIIPSGKLCQTQSYKEAKKERSKSCKFDSALVSAESLEQHLEECQKDVSSKLSFNLMGHLSECITGRIHGETYPVDSQLPAELCCVDSVSETATAKFMCTSPFLSPDSVIAGSSFTVDQSPPNTLDCQNMLDASNSLENKRTNHIFSSQTAVPEVKSSVLREQHGCLTANSQPYSSAFSTFLKGASETDAAMQYSTGMLGSSDMGPEESSCTAIRCVSEARSYPDNTLSKTSKTQESEEHNFRCSNEAPVSESKLSALEQALAHQDDNNQLFDAVLSTFPIEVKAEPLEESCTNSIPETSSQKLRSNNNQVFDSVLSTFPDEVKVEPLEETCTNNVPEIIAADRNFQENVLTDCKFSHQTSLPKDAPSSSATELLGTPILGSICSHSSENSCTGSQLAGNAGRCRDNMSLTGSNLKKETESICSDQESFPEKVDIDATDKLQKSILSNCQVKVKCEPLENNFLKPCKKPPSSFQDLNTLRAEEKGGLLDELSTDLIDHIPLAKRIGMLLSGNVSNSNYGNNLKHCQQTVQRTSSRGSINSLNAEASSLSLRRKRKKTATDSVETALQEDAPGLLQVLLDKGITTEEIKLYGGMEDGALDISSAGDSFEDLEAVINKLFSERSSLFKFPLVRHTNGSKAVYCLACLISLIEQTRYLRFRNSPVEWGWCRDLQSFIFIFERHNRIVLERPEYGYATYFFELVDSLPIDWQIKRLVTAMKLNSCSRTTLIENRSLLVGEDLTEGEACVLEGYGWTPNSGLGTLLNYCDRVVHDKRYENDSSEWRAKIGKLLMDGHDGGRTVVAGPPKKVLEYMGDQNPSIKLEF